MMVTTFTLTLRLMQTCHDSPLGLVSSHHLMRKITRLQLGHHTQFQVIVDMP